MTKLFKLLLLVTSCCLLVTLFSGCGTCPVREDLVTYDIKGTTYVPLIPLCEKRGVAWEYDTYSKTISLSGGTHKISLRVGDALALVDGRPEHLRHPVEIYQGVIVVPLRFKELVFDDLFKYSPCTVVRPKGEFPLTSIKKVVIDAGHGGNDPGAIGRTGLREKDVNLDIAKRLSKLLRDEGVEVVMTRSSDVFVSLGRRCSIANNANADLFISIHANANPVRSLNGLEIYYITPKISDSKRAISSAGEDQLYFDNASFSGKSLNTKAILWDMIYTYNRAESIGLANQICKSVGHASNVRIIGAKAANFQVLRCTLMPSILIETGFLSNREEETLLKNSFYRQQITDAIMQGIRQYARDNVSPEVF